MGRRPFPHARSAPVIVFTDGPPVAARRVTGLAPVCSNCGASDFVWANDLKTGGLGGGSLSLRSRGELSLGTRICRSCGHADLFLKDPAILRMPHTWRPGEFTPITPRPAAAPPHHAAAAPTTSPTAAPMPPTGHHLPPPPPPAAPVPPPPAPETTSPAPEPTPPPAPPPAETSAEASAVAAAEPAPAEAEAAPAVEGEAAAPPPAKKTTRRRATKGKAGSGSS